MKGGVKMEQERGREMKRTTEQIVSNRHILERMTLNNSHSLNLKWHIWIIAQSCSVDIIFEHMAIDTHHHGTGVQGNWADGSHHSLIIRVEQLEYRYPCLCILGFFISEIERVLLVQTSAINYRTMSHHWIRKRRSSYLRGWIRVVERVDENPDGFWGLERFFKNRTD